MDGADTSCWLRAFAKAGWASPGWRLAHRPVLEAAQRPRAAAVLALSLTPFGPRTVPVSCREDPAARRGDTCPHGWCGGRPPDRTPGRCPVCRRFGAGACASHMHWRCAVPVSERSASGCPGSRSIPGAQAEGLQRVGRRPDMPVTPGRTLSGGQRSRSSSS